MNWEFTDVEFRVLTNRFLDGAMPPPLVYTSRTEDDDVYRRELQEVEAQLDDRLNTLGAVFETLAKPEVVVFVHSWCDSDMDNPDKHIRVHGARRDRRAVMVIEKPAETLWHSGGFTVTECGPEELAGLMVAQLPATGTGRGPAVQIVVDPPDRDTDHAPRPLAFDSFDDPVEARSLAFLSRPADRSGSVRVAQGRSKYGPRGMMAATLVWRDLPDDGRYLIEVDPVEMQAVGVSPQRLAERIEQQVGLVLQHMEARGEVEE